ncbi:MAG: alpha-L-rhamnosidase N-terminal domain-containing protein, partial [Actinomycetota bacterium]
MRWIWFRPPPPSDDSWGEARPASTDGLGHLRHTFSLDETPAAARCRATADGRYELWVNGTRVGRGPARSDPSLLAYDEYDIAPLLRAGPNVVAALVRHYGRPTLWWVPAHPDGELGFGSFLLDATIAGRGGETRIESGPGWKARPAATTTVEPAHARVKFAPPETEGPPPLEIVDGASVPWGWIHPSYDDEDWADAYVMGEASFDALDPRGTPTLEPRGVAPIAVVGQGPAGPAHAHPLAAIDADLAGTRCDEEPHTSLTQNRWITYDMGEIVNGHPFVALDAGAGAIFDLACGEDMTADGKPVTAPREWAMRVVAGGHDGERHESFEAVGFRYLSIAARTENASAVSVGATEMLAPRTRGAYFRCSDPALEEIWSTGARTVDLCTTDAFIDCPGRE